MTNAPICNQLTLGNKLTVPLLNYDATSRKPKVVKFSNIKVAKKSIVAKTTRRLMKYDYKDIIMNRYTHNFYTIT